jgi:hypothetical protein
MERAAQKEAQAALKQSQDEEAEMETIWAMGANKKGAAKAAGKSFETPRPVLLQRHIRAADMNPLSLSLSPFSSSSPL